MAPGAAPDPDDGEPEADEALGVTAVESDDGAAAPAFPGDEVDAGDPTDGVAGECVDPCGAVTDGVETLGVETEGTVTEGVETAGVEIEGTVTDGVETAGVETDGRPPVGSVSASLEIGAKARIASDTSASTKPAISPRNAIFEKADRWRRRCRERRLFWPERRMVHRF